MTVNEAMKLLRQRMDENGLQAWEAGTRCTKNIMGSCDYNKRTIKLSTHMVKLASYEDVHAVILHEIAHAVSYKLYGNAGKGHGGEFKLVSSKLARMYSVKDDFSKSRRSINVDDNKFYKYTFTCPACGDKAYRHRISKTAKYYCNCQVGKDRSDIEYMTLKVNH